MNGLAGDFWEFLFEKKFDLFGSFLLNDPCKSPVVNENALKLAEISPLFANRRSVPVRWGTPISWCGIHDPASNQSYCFWAEKSKVAICGHKNRHFISPPIPPNQILGSGMFENPAESHSIPHSQCLQRSGVSPPFLWKGYLPSDLRSGLKQWCTEFGGGQIWPNFFCIFPRLDRVSVFFSRRFLIIFKQIWILQFKFKFLSIFIKDLIKSFLWKQPNQCCFPPPELSLSSTATAGPPPPYILFWISADMVVGKCQGFLTKPLNISPV